MASRQVTKEEFDKFVADYPNPLQTHVFRIGEPPQIQFYDEKLGVWPEFVVCYISKEWLPHDHDLYYIIDKEVT